MALLLSALPAPAQEPAGSPLRPAPLDARLLAPTAGTEAGAANRPDYAVQVLHGIGGGVVGAAAVGGVWALYRSTLDPADRSEYDLLTPVVGGVVFGYPLGSAAGVYLGGRRAAPGGSAALTLGGAALGFATGLAAARLTGGVSYLLGPPAGAALGYDLGLRRRQRATAAPPAD